VGTGASEEVTEPVPGRACGDCTVCCTALAIETRDLRKQPGVTCAHCGPRGCTIYETRYPICRTYHCGWRVLGTLDQDWRPDKSGVLVSPLDDGIELLVLGGENAIRRPGFAEFVAACIRSGTPTFMAVPGPVGYYSARVALNDRLKGRDPAGIRDTLVGALAASAAHGFRRMEGG
jgi:hypothetical protein